MIVALASPMMSLAVLSLGMERLRQRLLLGAQGIALWTPDLSSVVFWDELGTVWRRVRPQGLTRQPLTVVLEHTNGTRLAITTFFADHHQVALRVLEELDRRTGSREEPLCPGEASEAITPAEHRVSEPGETA
jgi:hypothetical protein